MNALRPPSLRFGGHLGKIFLCFSDLRATDFLFQKGKGNFASVFRLQFFGRAECVPISFARRQKFSPSNSPNFCLLAQRAGG